MSLPFTREDVKDALSESRGAEHRRSLFPSMRRSKNSFNTGPSFYGKTPTLPLGRAEQSFPFFRKTWRSPPPFFFSPQTAHDVPLIDGSSRFLFSFLWTSFPSSDVICRRSRPPLPSGKKKKRQGTFFQGSAGKKHWSPFFFLSESFFPYLKAFVRVFFPLRK